MSVPMLLGHEAAGRIIELGDGVDSLSVGTRVVMTFLPRCGECAGCATDGRMPCTVGSAANNDGSLLGGAHRVRGSEEHTSELQSLMRISYAVFCLKKKTKP